MRVSMYNVSPPRFLSTLSLRRATHGFGHQAAVLAISIHALLAESDVLLFQLFCAFFDFYPRSPCGERPILGIPNQVGTWISIHALLAESDTLAAPSYMSREISIHALLAESDS